MYALFTNVLILVFAIQEGGHIQFSLGPNYSVFQLFQDEEETETQWSFSGEFEMRDFIPHLGLKVRGTKLSFERSSTFGTYRYEYLPLTLCTSFDILPFIHSRWVRLSAETGIGIYLWKGFLNDEVITLPSGEKMEERDIGFIGGFTLQLIPLRFIGIEFSSRYNYLASSDIYKYGFYDKDEKIWENGLGLKLILP
ncbi:MAG TPA: hypothetical protein ENI34_09280 [candidate division WOR-3 bacterium]|uniref:Uncharacterized protein n=1 Tax=candidate division WOR-3 bacterium TaxID=2052148 RepID=A0A9C9ENN1_UNCW3|nr:hypothetical protein [candidate division WOR-3 bacterium]